MRKYLQQLTTFCVIAGGLTVSSVQAADPPTPKLALGFKPKQADVEYDKPAASQYSKCKVTVVRKGKASGWVVVGPGGETLRKFMDTDGDNIVDHWGYFLRGLEVYRDVDSDADNKIDQFRWMNTGGSRWGIDKNADGFVDTWKVISAEEASREAVRGLVSGNVKILEPLLLSDKDMAQLGLSAAVAKQLRAQVADAKTKLLKNKSAAKGLNQKTRWLQFINSIPGTIPAEQIGAHSDLYVYENAMATVETGAVTALVQIGEMVRVGDGWKLTGIPQLMNQNAVQVGGVLMHPAVAATATPTTGSASENPELSKLIDRLQKLDRNSPILSAGRTEMAKYYAARADLLTELRQKSDSRELRDQWTRQLTDGLAAGAQTGVYPEGLKRLAKLEDEVKESSTEEDNVPYVVYRRKSTEYNVLIRDASNEERNKIQKTWLADLESFVKKYPKSQDAPEAVLQIAIANEFNGKDNVKDAKKWYQTLIDQYPDSPSFARASGAVRRMDLTGQTLQLSGAGIDGGKINASQYRGKVLLVLYWATWCKPCTEDLPLIRELYAKHHKAGFEIVGVNLDTDPAAVKPYLNQHKVVWPQIYEPGGVYDSPPSKAFGVINLPTLFLVDRSGKVVHRNASVGDLKSLLPELLENKPSKLGAGDSLKGSETK